MQVDCGGTTAVHRADLHYSLLLHLVLVPLIFVCYTQAMVSNVTFSEVTLKTVSGIILLSRHCLPETTLETTLGQMAPPESGRVHECHLIQVAF